MEGRKYNHNRCQSHSLPMQRRGEGSTCPFPLFKILSFFNSDGDEDRGCRCSHGGSEIKIENRD